MRYRRLGGTGLEVSQICLGMLSYGDPSWRDWVLDEESSRPFVERAAESGVNFFDTADVYSVGASEVVTGRLLRDVFMDRGEYVVATKVGLPMGAARPNNGGLSRSHILSSCDASLRRLDLDHIDLLQIHRLDRQTPIEETMEALNDLVRWGKVRYIGACSMWAWQLAKAQYIAQIHGWTRFVSMQCHYNLLYREQEREMMALLADQNMACVPWGPLARGRLGRADQPDPTRGTDRAQNDAYADRLYEGGSQEVLRRVAELAARDDAPPAQIALAWLLHQPGVTAPVVGVRQLSHFDAVRASVDHSLSEGDLAYLAEPYEPMPVREHD